ncbi:FtsQ-type POTRA domain-containing protein [Kibdelosporangium philippinense]|uniref:FtsQ-type POTRA domain-containing protein n=1 Tax=Kibdelosporangium philippinense TaxID=211113 RepID=A0ABS8ZLG4_9PSEU|nr:FtsQ-type POTRA domain-containing protein [Kibdelosporangium philippinense]MCE7007466.1 FtsQ-type POTRA domain-containing protein [Kibdelosporangium philippinense]
MTTPTRPESRRPASSAGAAARERREKRELLRPTRRRALMRRWMVVLVFFGIVGLLYVILFTPVLGVRSVDVQGLEGLTPDEVRTVAAVEMGKPLVRLDTGEIADRVATLPRVAKVSVERSWPSTVEIIITERTPVAYAKLADGAHMVDATGADYAVVPQAPAGLPSIEVATLGTGDAATRAVVDVLGRIPPQLKERVVTLAAKTPGDVQLRLTTGQLVKWGNAADSERKAMVLAALLQRPGKTYDVAAPDLPTVS